MNKTKKNIILAAIRLFNEKGLGNVLNQDIANEAGISLSNFNYHFKTKKLLVFEVCNHMRLILEERISNNKIITQEALGLEISKIFFEFQEEFKFFYLDTHNILQTYPALQEEMQKQINEAIQIIKNLNYMAVGMGYLNPEPEDFPGLYDRLAEQVWVNNHFWFAQKNVRGLEGSTVKQGLESSYWIAFPYLTELGKKAYRQFIEQLEEVNP